jgi:hypothetical protein
VEKVVEKIRNLQAHARSARGFGSDLEADAFEERARRLMSRHGVTQTEVDAAAPADISAVAVGADAYGCRDLRRRTAWAEILAEAVARAHSCRSLVRPRSNRLVFVGAKGDLRLAAYRFITLARACSRASVEDARLMRELFEEYWPGEWPGERAYADSYRTGFSRAVRERYERRARGESEGPNPSAVSSPGALVRSGRGRGLRVEAELGRVVARSARPLSLSRLDARPFRRGYCAGREAELEGAALPGAASPRLDAGQPVLTF